MRSIREGTFKRITWASDPVARVSIKELLGAVSLLGMGRLRSLRDKTVPRFEKRRAGATLLSPQSDLGRLTYTSPRALAHRVAFPSGKVKR